MMILKPNAIVLINIIKLSTIFISSLVWLYLLASNLSFKSNQNNEEEAFVVRFPNNFEQLKLMSTHLGDYYKSNPLYMLLLFSSAYLFKQTFAVPGSLFLNLLAGALFGLKTGFILCSFLTAIGATFCYTLSNLYGKQLVLNHFKVKVDMLREKINQHDQSLIYFLLFLRLFPMSPNWFLNMASPIVGIPVHLFFFSVLIGLMPYNFICVQMGQMLSQLKSTRDVMSTNSILALIAFAFVALAPGIVMKYLRKQKNN